MKNDLHGTGSMDHFVTSLEQLAATPPRHLLLLYSGGLDGTFLLHWLASHQIPVTALGVRIGRRCEPDPVLAAGNAARFGAAYQQVDLTDVFFADFLPAAIHADAYYQGQYPVGSTLTRPLMASAGVRLAGELGCDAIAHTATYLQNSALRLTGSIVALDPRITVVAPFLGSDLPRQQKMAILRETGVRLPSTMHSVDTNPWARVIESGSLENPESVLDESVFTLTRDVLACPDEPATIELEFVCGLPVALDGVRLGLGELVAELNALAGEHGVGRFSGLEDSPFAVKSHEVREAPAAAVITTAHRALANAVYGLREHTIRAGIAQEWTNLVVHGGWYATVTRALAGCLAELDRPLTGTVRLRLHRATVTVLRLHSPNGLYHARLGAEFHQRMGQYSYGPWLAQMTLAEHIRGGGDRVPAAAGARLVSVPGAAR